MIDASTEFGSGTNQNHLRAQDVARIASAFHGYADENKYSRVVDLDEIEKNDFNLNLSRYIDTTEAEEVIDVRGALARLRTLEQERAAAEAAMNGFLEELGYE